MMMGFGFLFMLLILVVPVLLIVALVIGLAGNSRPGNSGITHIFQQSPTAPPGPSCVHCGARLQAGWAHCPQCGAPTHSDG